MRATVAWAVLHLMDVSTTMLLLQAGTGREGAPLVAMAIEAGPHAYALVSAAGLLAFPAILALGEKLQAPKTLVKLIATLLLALKTYTVFNNTMLLASGQGLPPPPLLTA